MWFVFILVNWEDTCSSRLSRVIFKRLNNLSYLVGLGLWGRKLDGDSAAIVHDGLDELPTRADHRVVDLGRNGDLSRHNVGHLFLDLLDSLDGLLHVLLLPRDGDHVRL